jgi:hypothetical protein
MIPKGFVNPLGRNPFAAASDTARLTLTEAELETAMRAYCRLWGIPVPAKGKARAKAIGKPRGKVTLARIPDTYLKGQQHLFREAAR